MAKKSPSRSLKKRDLHRLVVARSDVWSALLACRLVLERINNIGDDLYRPLLDAITISYARPFTSNKLVGALPAKWSKFPSQRLQRVHNKLIMLRNKFVAHSDPYERSVEIIPPFITIPGAGKRTVKVSVGIRTVAFPLEIFRDIEALCLDLGRRLNQEVEAQLETLYADSILPGAAFSLTFDENL